MRYFVAVMLLISISACAEAPADEPQAEGAPSGVELETYADTVAWRMVRSMGGIDSWRSAPYMRFDFAIDSNGERIPVASHLWDRYGGDYRVEWSVGDDSTYVVLFNVHTQEGQAYLNSIPADTSENNLLVRHAYTRFINDTYWMLAPLKVFDSGVNRTYLPDSSSEEVDALLVTFDEVGLTPNDRYYLYVDKETGRLDEWAYVLQGNQEAAPSYYDWTGYERFSAPAGSLYIATRKESMSVPRAILTDHISMPDSVPSVLFTDAGRPLPDSM